MKFNIKQKTFSKGKNMGGFMKTNNIFFLQEFSYVDNTCFMWI